MKISIIGGGNIGTLMAAELAAQSNEVTVYSRKPKEWSKHITVYGKEMDVVLESELTKITNNIEQAVSGAELIWITTPASTFNKIAQQIEPYVRAGQRIGVVPGSGGAEFAFQNILKKGCILFGLQRVHSIARLETYGHSVHMLGRKEELQIGAIPSSKTGELCELIERFFSMPCIPLANYLSVTLTPSNPILHTTRLYSMFRDYKEGDVYPRNYLFYEEWNEESSRMLIACDEELMELCHAIPLDLTGVKSLRAHYESGTVEAMTKKISGIEAFAGLTSPMKSLRSGWVPDFTSRYFTADFSYGIKVLIDLADVYEIEVPNMKKVWNWYVEFAEEQDCFRLNLSRAEVERLYQTGE